MRHRIKAGKIGSFTPEEQKVEQEQLEDREVIEDVEDIFEEDTEISNDDEPEEASTTEGDLFGNSVQNTDEGDDDDAGSGNADADNFLKSLYGKKR